jgi:stage III sporulation protein SpoIIIAA
MRGDGGALVARPRSPVACEMLEYRGCSGLKIRFCRECVGYAAQVFIKIVRVEEACAVLLQSRPACDWAVYRDRSSARETSVGGPTSSFSAKALICDRAGAAAG